MDAEVDAEVDAQVMAEAPSVRKRQAAFVRVRNSLDSQRLQMADFRFVSLEVPICCGEQNVYRVSKYASHEIVCARRLYNTESDGRLGISHAPGLYLNIITFYSF